MDHLRSDALARRLEVPGDEDGVGLVGDRPQVQRLGGLEERSLAIGEDGLHHAAVATTEDELHVAELLHLLAQQGFGVPFRVFGDLLEFIERDHYGFLLALEVAKEFVQRHGLLHPRTCGDTELGQSGERVEIEAELQRTHRLGHLLQQGVGRLTHLPQGLLHDAQHHALLVGGAVQVHEHRGELPLAREEVPDQGRLAQPPQGDDGDVALVGHGSPQEGELIHAVAERIRTSIALEQEGIEFFDHSANLHILCHMFYVS